MNIGSTLMPPSTYGTGMASKTSQSSAPDAGAAPKAVSNTPGQDEFQAYMKKTPSERMMDRWLAAHNLTQDQLNAMPTHEREAILKQMRDDIRREVEDSAKKKPGTLVNLQV